MKFIYYLPKIAVSYKGERLVLILKLMLTARQLFMNVKRSHGTLISLVVELLQTLPAIDVVNFDNEIELNEDAIGNSLLGGTTDEEDNSDDL
jgi:hypothetical protein